MNSSGVWINRAVISTITEKVKEVASDISSSHGGIGRNNMVRTMTTPMAITMSDRWPILAIKPVVPEALLGTVSLISCGYSVPFGLRFLLKNIIKYYKELQKQKKIVTSIIRRIRKENYKYKLARNETIKRSAFEKLNGMAVGRIKLYNYRTCENKICWTDGLDRKSVV